MQVDIIPSDRKGKKFTALFSDNNRIVLKIHFGAKGYEDYTSHKDENRKRLYLLRHQKEDWSNAYTAGTLSRYILWNKPTLSDSIRDYKERFKFK